MLMHIHRRPRARCMGGAVVAVNEVRMIVVFVVVAVVHGDTCRCPRWSLLPAQRCALASQPDSVQQRRVCTQLHLPIVLQY